MKTHAQLQPPAIQVVPAAPEDEPVLANLLELYMHDFSEFLHLDLRADGRFGYPHLALYWRDSGRHPFLVRADGKLAGFVLVKRGSDISDNAEVWNMAEFFVVRAYRRRRLGTAVAHTVWQRFAGLWEVRVLAANHSGHRFWARAIDQFVGQGILSVPMQLSGKSWHVFAFDSSRVTQPSAAVIVQ